MPCGALPTPMSIDTLKSTSGGPIAGLDQPVSSLGSVSNLQASCGVGLNHRRASSPSPTAPSSAASHGHHNGLLGSTGAGIGAGAGGGAGAIVAAPIGVAVSLGKTAGAAITAAATGRLMAGFTAA